LNVIRRPYTDRNRLVGNNLRLRTTPRQGQKAQQEARR
jgi:hypothetical protein